MSDWPVGFSTGCFYRRDLFEVLELIHAGGFSMLEISSAPDHLDYHDRDRLERLRRDLDDLTLEAYSFHAPYGEGIDISSPDRVVRERARDEMLRAVEAAALLRARHFVLHPGPETSDDVPVTERAERLRHTAAVLDVVARRCRDLGVGLCLENKLGHLLFSAPQDLLWLLGSMREVDVGVCLDTGHAFLTRDLAEVVRKLGPYVRMVHAHDNRGESDEGSIDWTDLVTRLDDMDFHGGLIVELDGDSDDDPVTRLASARHARWFLRHVQKDVATGAANRSIPDTR